MNELVRLHNMLEQKRISHTFILEFYGNSEKYDRRLLKMYDKNNYEILSAVCHYGSYGYEQNLIEIMGFGFLTKKEYENDSVLGYLTAEDVLERIIKYKQGE